MIKVCSIGDRKICVKGIGRMFSQQGFPISMAIAYMKNKGVEVSLYHVADEMLKHLWASGTRPDKIPDRVISMLQHDIEDSVIDGVIYSVTIDDLTKFCYASYEDQREMIFKYLFGMDSSKGVDVIRKFLSK